MNDHDYKIAVDRKSGDKRRSRLAVVVAVVGLTIAGLTAYFTYRSSQSRSSETPPQNQIAPEKESPTPPQKPIAPEKESPTPSQKPIAPAKESLVQPRFDFEEVFFRVGESHVGDEYVTKVISMLDRTQRRDKTLNGQKQEWHLYIVCSGDSRGDFDRTKEISDLRACELKGHVAEHLKEDYEAFWDSATVWSFGTTVTPGLIRQGVGEDFNCSCMVIAEMDPASVERRYEYKLKEAKDREKYLRISSELKDYEIKCNGSPLHPRHSH